MRKIVFTADGSHSIYIPELDEHYHSVNGAVQESEHIFIKNGFESCGATPLHIFEVGFGTGLNALMTATRCINGQREVYYTAIEKYPLDDTMVRLLNYDQFTGDEGKNIFRLIHDSVWGQMNRIWRNFYLMKIKGDVVTDHLTGSFNLIFFDAFGPDKQPEMWTTGIFKKIAEVTVTDGLLVTYSAKGYVKKNLRACGFKVKRFPGPPGKRHFIKAVKI